MNCLSGSLPFLLGYMKKHARDCFEEVEKPRKMHILLLYIFILLGLFLLKVRLYNTARDWNTVVLLLETRDLALTTTLFVKMTYCIKLCPLKDVLTNADLLFKNHFIKRKLIFLLKFSQHLSLIIYYCLMFFNKGALPNYTTFFQT